MISILTDLNFYRPQCFYGFWAETEFLTSNLSTIGLAVKLFRAVATLNDGRDLVEAKLYALNSNVKGLLVLEK